MKMLCFRREKLYKVRYSGGYDYVWNCERPVATQSITDTTVRTARDDDDLRYKRTTPRATVQRHE